MRRPLLCLPALLLLASCASSPPKSTLNPTEMPVYSTRCSGTGHKLEACYRKVAEACPGGHTITHLESGTAAAPISGDDFIAAPYQNMVVECK